jgi:PPK2 family polyphosphate:nucleotide phosphotransferase
MDLMKRFLVPAGKVRLSDWNADDTGSFKNKQAAQETLEENIRRLAELQYLMFAENKRSLLVILQGMDASGKDGTIRHVMTGLNPQSCRVVAFKEPSAQELAHDYLWRIHQAVPARGEVTIFNRSQYEDVLVVRVRKLVPPGVWRERYEQINAFERHLSQCGVHIVKLFLHISKAEQFRRFKDRVSDPRKQWKITPEDLASRKLWPKYTEAYEDALTQCNTPEAPWYIIPADSKWFRNLAVSAILLQTLESLRLKLPAPKFDLSKVHLT